MYTSQIFYLNYVCILGGRELCAGSATDVQRALSQPPNTHGPYIALARCWGRDAQMVIAA